MDGEKVRNALGNIIALARKRKNEGSPNGDLDHFIGFAQAALDATPPEIEHSLGMYAPAPETPDERQAAIVAALRKKAEEWHDPHTEHGGGVRDGIERGADFIESDEWRR